MRVWASKKKLSTTYTTTITSIEEPTLQELQQDVAGNEEEKVIQVNKIESVQKLEKFLRCTQCNRRLLQGSCSAVVRCDNCNSMMRAEQCPKSLTAKLVILQPDGQELSITVNDNVLSQFFEVDVVSMDDNMLGTSLLSMTDITLTYEQGTLQCLKIMKSA